MAKRLALVQADIWANRSEAGDIYELDPLLAQEATCTRTVFGTLVDDLAHQGHLLVRYNKGLKCKGCNVYREDRQFKFWNRQPLRSKAKCSRCHSETRKDCTSTRSQPTRSAQHQVSMMDSARTSPRGLNVRSARVKWKRGPLSPNLEHAVQRPANTPRNNPILAPHVLVKIFMARTVIWIVSLCFFPLSLKVWKSENFQEFACL